MTILSSFLAGLATIAQAWLLSRIINDVFLRGHALDQVSRALLGFLFLIALRAALTWGSEVTANVVAVRVKTDLRQRLFAHLLRLGPAYTRGQRTGELTTAAVEGIEALDAYYSQYLPHLVITALVPFSILVVVFPIDLLTGFVFLVTAPLIPFFMIMIGKGAEAITHRQYEKLSLLSAHFLDSLQGLTTLKVFGRSKAQTKTIAQASEQYRQATLGVLRVTFLSALALELLATISTAIVAVEIGFRLLYGFIEFQPALFLLVLAPEFYMPLRALGARFHAGMSGVTAARRIFEVLDVPAPPPPTSTDVPEAPSPLPDLKSTPFTIHIQDLTYTYPGETTPALQGITLSIPSDQHLALVGKTGAGKSTLVNLLLGFLHPTSGSLSLSVNGRLLPFPPPQHHRPTIAWVPQRPYLFHDTIANNIKLGRPEASLQEVIAAARSAHLHDFIQTLPQGYDTVIGEGGARLSAGQAQRLALARAFLLDAPILILDEPTSSLDPETEALLEESTRRLIRGRTVITIAHRLNTIFQADRILVLDQGRLVEQGTHRHLLAQNGLYAAMVRTYQSGFEAEGRPISDGPIPMPATSPASDVLSFPEPTALPYRGASILARLLAFLQGHWGRVALSVLLGAGTVGASVALMGTSAWLISTAAIVTSVADLGVSVVGTRFFGISRALLRYLERLVSHDVTFRLLARLRVWFYEKLEPLAPARLMEFRSGDLLARIVGDVETLENFYVRVVSPPLAALIVGLGTALFLGSFSPTLGPAYLTVFLALGVILPLLSQVLSRRPAIQTITLRADLHTRLVDGIQGMADLIAFRRSAERLSQLTELGWRYGEAQRRMARIAGLYSAFSILLTNLGLWIVLVLSIPLVSAGQLAGPMLAALALLTLASFEAVTPLPAAAQMWNACRRAAQRLFEIVDTRPAVEEPPESPAELASKSIPPHLQIVHLTFSYPNPNGRDPLPPAVQDVTFDLPPGRSLAIVGPSGAGKSTIAHLILRFWEYQDGDIYLGGRSIRQLHPEHVRAHIAVVSQNAYFFNASIRDNLRLARRRLTQEEIEAAARAAQIHDFIVSLPNGYDTRIGEQGLRLSGGERQRLAIARAILKNAPILILDEPTANLDPLTEQQVLENLFALMKQKTSLLITHRLVGLDRVDEILVLDRGRIVERGHHDDLLASNGLYRRLWDLQHHILD